MKNRIFIKLVAIALSLGLCGCTTLSDVGTVDEEAAAKEYYWDTSSGSSATSSEITNISGIYYDPVTGEIKSENSDIYSLIGADSKSTIDDEYKEGVPDDIGAALETKLATDHDKLWNVEGDPAFYIPDYHSAKAEDLKNFILLELCDDGESVIYSYETAYYGDVGNPLNGGLRVGIAKKNHTHINWNVPKKEKDNADYKPSTNWEVYCFMKYNTVTREYRIFDVRLGVIDKSKSSDSDKASSVSDEALVNTLKEYDPGKRRMFAGKFNDTFNRFTGGYLYYSMYDMHYTLMDANGNILRQTDATTLVSEGINNYVKQNVIAEKTGKKDSELEIYYRKSNITYSIANCNITVAGGLLMELNVNVQMPDQSETAPYSVFCNYAMFSNKSSTEAPVLVSERQGFSNTSKSETAENSAATVKQSQSAGSKMSWFSLEDATNQKMLAIKILDSDIFDKSKNSNADKYFGYLNTLLKRYMELYREDADENTLDDLWKQAYNDVSGLNWGQKVIRTIPADGSDSRNSYAAVAYNNDEKVKNYVMVMKTVARPAAVTGDNLEYLMNQHNGSGNIRFGLVGISEVNDTSQKNVSVSLYRSGSTNIEIIGYTYSDADDSSDDEDDDSTSSANTTSTGSGTDNSSLSSGNSDEDDSDSDSSQDSDDDAEQVITSVTIKINDGGSSVDLFDVMGAGDDLALTVSDEGNVVYYWARTSGDEKNTTKILMPYGWDTTGRWGGAKVISDLAGQVTFLQDKTDSDNLHHWIIAALGDEGVWILRSKSKALSEKSQKEYYQWDTIFQIPYMMTVTPSNEIGETTVMTYKDTDDKTVTKDVGQKASLTGRNSIAYEETSGSTYGKYRFTTLQSGILVYDPSSKTTIVADSGQYYGSWKMSDGSYTAIGFKTRVQDAGFEDIMKAKIYHGLKASEEDQFLWTLKQRLKIDKDLQKRFLKEPDGWKDVCKEYNFNPDLYSDKKIENYAKKLISINKAYDAALQKFWTIVKFVPTKEQKEKIESQFYYCVSETAMDQLITSTMEEYLNTDDVIKETEDIFAGSTKKIVDDGWIYKVQESQRKAMEKKAKQEYIKTITGSTEDEEWQKTLEELFSAVKNKRNMWNN